MKILFADNSLWAQLNFRGSIITHLRDVGHEVVMVSPIDAQSQEIVIPDRIRHIAIEMRRTSTNPLHDILYFFRLMSIYWKEAGMEAVIGLEKFHNWKSSWNGIYSHRILYCLRFV